MTDPLAIEEQFRRAHDDEADWLDYCQRTGTYPGIGYERDHEGYWLRKDGQPIGERREMSAVEHPEHRVMAGPTYIHPAKPLRASWGLLRWQVERACRKRGGHWWHPDGPSGVDWFCCQCGKQTEGAPKDGR